MLTSYLKAPSLLELTLTFLTLVIFFELISLCIPSIVLCYWDNCVFKELILFLYWLMSPSQSVLSSLMLTKVLVWVSSFLIFLKSLSLIASSLFKLLFSLCNSRSSWLLLGAYTTTSLDLVVSWVLKVSLSLYKAANL